MLDDFLTEEEALALPDGTEVEITWSGGNGPHRYFICRDARGNVSVKTGGSVDYIHSLRFVGKEPYHTHVRLARSVRV